MIYTIMGMKLFSTLLGILFCVTVFAGEPAGLVVNNRILVQVNGKKISVLDVMKKMNVALNQYYPEYANHAGARYEFFSTQWKEVLSQMIDHELILADAEKLEVTIKDADIREKLQERFGPNVVASLENLGISYDEAREMIRTELVVQRMTWFRINSKAILRINPVDIKGAYKDFCVNNAPQDEWKYQSLAIRSEDPKEAEELSEKAYELLAQGKAGLDAVVDELRQLKEFSPDTSITVSQELCVPEKDLSESHRTVLASLNEGSFSKPIEQISRDSKAIKRIFQLKEHSKKIIPSFHTLADKLEDQLIQKAIAEETSSYVFKLRKRFGFDESQLMEIPSNFQPFVLVGDVPLPPN
jgi:hypothetical protein